MHSAPVVLVAARRQPVRTPLFYSHTTMSSWIQRLVQVLLGVLGIWALTRWVPRVAGSWLKRIVPLILSEILVTTLTIWLSGRSPSKKDKGSAS